MGETAVEPKTSPLTRRGRAIGDNGSTMGASAAGALGSVDRLSPIDRSLKSPWPVGETAGKPKRPPLARRAGAIGDNGSTMEDPAAGALGIVDRLSPIDRLEALAELAFSSSAQTEDARKKRPSR